MTFPVTRTIYVHDIMYRSGKNIDPLPPHGSNAEKVTYTYTYTRVRRTDVETIIVHAYTIILLFAHKNANRKRAYRTRVHCTYISYTRNV